ncbi:carboxypeptidase-like regulatory domain-containing protein [Nocardioides sp. YIM 152315]|uniref:carboxypeptidase-like regulatory domain-containing protein n=1 Tax=Nocardioides sp. YIM 152315 TaxID=3031760 RepID=UPI0023DBF318|nr:carboxypeptidase-like regulatory domain-containing protein [Nocardioides sp. YIM 152315]MDF1602157.1 carboxypeptidase-like regulatory domain-containing protein [Nocardioides sp. YIM 152315]
MTIATPTPRRRLLSAAAVAALAGSALVAGTATPASAVPIPPGSITGVVVGPDGAPAPGVSVYVTGDLNGDGDYNDPEDSFDNIDTGAGGDYAFAHLAAANYQVQFSGPGYQNQSTLVSVGAGNSALPTTILAAEAPFVVVDANTDITGTVTNAATGLALPGASVTAYNATTGAYVQGTTVDVTGAYEFEDLDPSIPVKLMFTRSGGGGLLGYENQWSGGARSKGAAAVVTLTPGTPVTVSAALTQYAGITGKVLNPGGGVPYSASVVAFDADTAAVSFATVRPDGAYYLDGLHAGESYRLRFTGYDLVGNDTANDGHTYLDVWHGGSNDFTHATALTTGAPGTFTTGIDATFDDSLTVLEKPSIAGTFAIGKTLKANPGRWSKNGGSVFTYAWLRGSKTLATGPTYKPAKADAGRKISLQVTNSNLYAGEERVATVTVTGKVAKYASKIDKLAKTKKGKLTVKVKAGGEKAKKIKGKVVLKKGKKTIAKAKVKKGKAKFPLKGQLARPGKHKFTVKYTGNKTTFAYQGKIKVTVRK